LKDDKSKIVKVNVGNGYDVVIGGFRVLHPQSVGERVRVIFPKAKIAAIITDDNVKEFYLEPVSKSLSEAGFATVCFSIPPGENSKNSEQYLSLLNWLCENKVTRSDVIIALGGGVVGDLAGFAAATYLRGIPYVQIPTTLLAMVDSSVGGKTGIDLPAGKNLIGAFYQPSLVLCDISTLATLPENVFKDGCAEVIKYGMIASAAILELLKGFSYDDKSNALVQELVEKCVSIKRYIVQRDEFDTGERMLLNFGHTIAHAIEKLSSYTIPHGFAVAAGMAIDTRAAFKKGLCPKDCLDTLEDLLNRFALPSNTDYSARQLYEAALSDKKRAGDEITIIIPIALGKCELKKIPAVDLLDWIETGLAV
jgi:3-dehydroquinate synthase